VGGGGAAGAIEAIRAALDAGTDVREVGGLSYWWGGALAHTVKTGETAFDALYGQDTWTWFGDHPDAARLFDGLMDEITLAEAEALRSWLLKATVNGASCLDEPLVSQVTAELAHRLAGADDRLEGGVLGAQCADERVEERRVRRGERLRSGNSKHSDNLPDESMLSSERALCKHLF